MRRSKTGAGLLTRLDGMHTGTLEPLADRPTTAVPWDDAKVREILGPAAEAENVRSRGLIFAMDATSSRQPTWDRATEVQASMFSALATGLKVQLVYFRGAEFRASAWSRRPEELAAQMRGVACMAGGTQIERVLSHAYREAEKGDVAALVYVGDCMEELRTRLAAQARKLAARRVRAFLFQEGSDPVATASFQEIAELTRGAHCGLGQDSAAQLEDLLSAAAAYATGGTSALARLAAAADANEVRRPWAIG